MPTSAVTADGDFVVSFPDVTPFPCNVPFLVEKDNDNEFFTNQDVNPDVVMVLSPVTGEWQLTMTNGADTTVYESTFVEAQRLGANVTFSLSAAGFGTGWPATVVAAWKSRLSVQVTDILEKVCPQVFAVNFNVGFRGLLTRYDRSVYVHDIATALLAFAPNVFTGLSTAESIAVAALKYVWYWVADAKYNAFVDKARCAVLLGTSTQADEDVVDQWYESTVFPELVAAAVADDEYPEEAEDVIASALATVVSLLFQEPYNPPSPAQPPNVAPTAPVSPGQSPNVDYQRPIVPAANDDNFGRIALAGMNSVRVVPRPPEVIQEIAGRMTAVLPPFEPASRGIVPIARRRIGIHVNVGELNSAGHLTIPFCCVNTFEGTVFRIDQIEVLMNAGDFSGDANDRQTFEIEARRGTSASNAVLADPFAQNIAYGGSIHPDAVSNGILNMVAVMNDARNEEVSSPGRLAFGQGVSFSLRVGCRDGPTAAPPTITRCTIFVTGSYVHVRTP